MRLKDRFSPESYLEKEGLKGQVVSPDLSLTKGATGVERQRDGISGFRFLLIRALSVVRWGGGDEVIRGRCLPFLHFPSYFGRRGRDFKNSKDKKGELE